MNGFCPAAVWQLGWRSRGAPTLLRSVPFMPHIYVSQGMFMVFPLNTFNMAKLCFCGTSSCLWPLLYCAGREHSPCYLWNPSPFNLADFPRDCRNHWQPDFLLERACVGFRTVVTRGAVSLGSQVWAINFQCCCLTINEVVAPGPDRLYLSVVSHLPAGHSPLVRTLH